MTPRAKARAGSEARKVFVLDTNVLMDDPAAIFRFAEHDIYIPMVVLEELDAAKKGMSDVARNARQASRFLDDLVSAASGTPLGDGLALPDAGAGNRPAGGPRGRLFFQIRILEDRLRELPLRNIADNVILGAVLGVQEERPEDLVILVSKDINLRIKATVLGIAAEDYLSDTALEDADMLATGVEALPADFWDVLGDGLESWQEDGRSLYRLHGEQVRGWHANDCLYAPARAQSSRSFEAVVREVEHDTAVLEVVQDFRSERHAVWGIRARNREQNFALNLLMDPEVDLVTILGAAGTGKTLLTLAAGLSQTLDLNRYSEIIMTRVTIPLGDDIGFLPGTEEEKMEPWMGALMDNLEVLAKPTEGGDWGRAATQDLLRNRIKIRSMNFMRGRTFLNRFVIIDEAQNLTSKQMKALVTRAGPGTKMVCLGNLAQIDTPYLTESTSGLTYLVSRFREWPHAGHITLMRGERSRLADFASDKL